ncbi:MULTISPECIES: hypothetical protein [Paenibacillus]|uniref:Apea-like HEPN domain-containing protein n=1 Tax=Paenibacillus cucumis (ex Kampfer et al. 2016) TaxID=1776858 RepID=A0ABS7KRA8_9BACL|nr:MULTISPECIES: hypothetical protein [Paenibacillus]MBY0206624.1 hypothetical protein [Paenibacillus cucumis (ex Kampfer et al. 2016)]MCM3132074.1 hypothetical protein [Paenibacillus polysaccharolyticus]MDP9698400.1 ABC-type methionine transport system ATPase subunit [Paenibacillus intestini]
MHNTDFQNDFMLDSEHSKELFAYYGLAVYYGQALEQQLVNLILLTKMSQGKVVTEEELEELYERKMSSSLGQLIHEARHHFTFSEEEISSLNELWQQRNRIVHHYFKERIHETFSPEGRTRMIKELQDFKERAQELELVLQQYIGAWMAALGLKDESAAAWVALERMHAARFQERGPDEEL